MSRILLAFISALVLSCNSIDFNCKTSIDYNLYDYSDLAKADDYIIDNFEGNEGEQLVYNICNYATKKCNSTETFASIFKGGDICKMASGSDSEITLINSENATEGIMITYDKGEGTIENETNKY